jgi:ion channel-forming bestrophin family protein
VLVAYPRFAMDGIGHELDNPFSALRASHRPLDLICQTIEADVLTLLSTDDLVNSSSRGLTARSTAQRW